MKSEIPVVGAVGVFGTLTLEQINTGLGTACAVISLLWMIRRWWLDEHGRGKCKECALRRQKID